MTRFLLVGAAHIDRIGRFDAPSVAAASNPGTIRTVPGGAAFNVASNLVALGGETRLATILGADEAGRSIRDAARDRGLDLLAQIGEGPTASYTAFLEPDGELTTALADMAIYDAFDPQPVAGEIGDLGRGDWLVIDANLPSETLTNICNGAHCRIAALTTSRAKAARLRPVLPRIDLLLTNRAEYAALQPQKPPGAMVMSNGGDPLAVVQNGQRRDLPIPAGTPPVDVTGAGDALAAAVLWAVSRDISLTDAARLGIAAAQAVIAVEGPWRSDLRDAIAAQISALARDNA